MKVTNEKTENRQVFLTIELELAEVLEEERKAKLAVTTVKKSMAHETSRWLRRNGSQVVDFSRGFLGVVMYLRIVSACGGSNPRSRSVSLIRSAPHSAFSLLNLRMRSCISREMGGRPVLLRDFRRQ